MSGKRKLAVPGCRATGDKIVVVPISEPSFGGTLKAVAAAVDMLPNHAEEFLVLSVGPNVAPENAEIGKLVMLRARDSLGHKKDRLLGCRVELFHSGDVITTDEPSEAQLDNFMTNVGKFQQEEAEAAEKAAAEKAAEKTAKKKVSGEPGTAPAVA